MPEINHPLIDSIQVLSTKLMLEALIENKGINEAISELTEQLVRESSSISSSPTRCKLTYKHGSSMHTMDQI